MPRKNCRPLLGKPLVGYSIEAAAACRLVDAVYVSTEDGEIARIAQGFGARLIERPARLASDTAQNDAVCRHALDEIRAAGGQPDVLVLLQPTSPLRTAAHLEGLLQAFLPSDAPSAMSVCLAEHHPGKCLLIRDGRLDPFTTLADVEARRQDMAVVHRQNGAIYAVRVPDFLAAGRFYLPPCLPYVMSAQDSIDIDSAVDLALAELMLRQRGESPAARARG